MWTKVFILIFSKLISATFGKQYNSNLSFVIGKIIRLEVSLEI